MAQPHTTLRQLFADPDPRAADPGALDAAFDPANNTVSPQAMLDRCKNSNEATVYLAHDITMDGPMPLVTPYDIDVFGGINNTNQVYAIVGDVTNDGAYPAAVVINRVTFTATAAATVPTLDTLSARYQALPDAEHLLPVPTADSENVATRNVIPVPHRYVSAVLEAYLAEDLDWRWVIVNIVEPILQDNNQRQAYTHFLNWLRVSCTRLPDDANGDPVRPATHFVYSGIFGTPRAVTSIPGIFKRYLPGLTAPANVNNNLATLAQHQQTMAAQLVRAAQPVVKTLMQVNPTIAEMALKVSEQPDIGQLTRYWQNYALVHKQGHQAALEQARNPAFPMALVSPKFSTDFTAGRWVASHNAAITEGFHLTRLKTVAHGPAAIRAHNQTASAFNVMELYSAGGDRLADMVLTPDALQLPATVIELTQLLRAYYGLISGIFGTTPSWIQTYRLHLIDPLESIQSLILQDYHDVVADVCLRITLFVFRHTNVALNNLLSGSVPTAANPRPTPQTPPYGQVGTSLEGGNIMSLVDVPAGLRRKPTPPVVPAPPAGDPARPPPREQPRNDRAPADRDNRRQEAPRHPVHGRDYDGENQNMPLRNAWTASGHTAFFTTGSPFHRPNTPATSNRAVIKRLAGDRSKRICIKMACSNECMSNCGGYHGELTPAEQQAVAREGGFPL